jgi:hypothetical protein
MAVSKTSLSAGELIREILLESADVSARTNKIFPVAVDKAVLPYILYRRAAMEQTPAKGEKQGADSVNMEIICFAADYDQCLELAEAVRDALDNLHNVQSNDGTLVLRASTLVDSEEAWQDDAYVQQLIFNVRI